jgi:hypothetical protein
MLHSALKRKYDSKAQCPVQAHGHEDGIQVKHTFTMPGAANNLKL